MGLIKQMKLEQAEREEAERIARLLEAGFDPDEEDLLAEFERLMEKDD